MNDDIDRGLERAARIVGAVVLALIVGTLAGALTSCMPAVSPSCPRRADDAETPAELAGGDACHRAGLNLAKVCPSLWRKDWDDFCRTVEKEGAMLCPAKLAKAKTCTDANAVCR